MKIQLLALAVLIAIATACSAGSSTTQEATTTPQSNQLPQVQFMADSAYKYIQAQLDFGPRVPGTKAHNRCADYLVETLHSYGADTVLQQKTTVEAFNGDKLPINNIMARYNVSAPKRLLLVAHWDTRPWADAETDASKHSKPIPGANDGGSGVAVLLEIARNLGLNAPSVGVDMLFTDAEDYGNTGGDDNSWCLGTQYWVENMPYTPATMPVLGILLDIVGGIDAKFYREYFSEYYAPQVNDIIWAEAASAGFGDKFPNERRGAVTDDHVYINQAGIPCIDIIECANPATGSFPPTWHTLDDDINSIDRNSLKAVGQVVMNTIYKQK
ncbi:MAG: M28 family peptidase [Muribaculaceae bacterium]|nr:M28 family peptidase [Muribaculaceae bacterium]